MKALTFLTANQCIAVDLDILHNYVSNLSTGLSHFLVGAADCNAGRIHIDNESADMRIFGQCFPRRARHDETNFGVRAIGDIALGAVQDITVAAARRHGLHRRRIGSAARFRQAETRNFARRDAGQPMRFLFGCAEFANGATRHAYIDRHRRTIGRCRVR